jgi:hypothetical protein
MSDEFEVGDVYALEAGLTGPEVFLFAFRVNRMIAPLRTSLSQIQTAIDKSEDEKEKKELEIKLEETRTAIIEGIKEYKEEHFKNYNKKTDKKLVASLLTLYKDKVVESQQPGFLKSIDKGGFDKYAKKLFCKSSFSSEKKMDKLIKKLEKGKTPKVIDMDADLAVSAAGDLINLYRGAMMRYGETEKNMEDGYRLFVEGIREMQPNKSFYPNANSTQRLTYGNVGAYKLSDKVVKNLRSTDGVNKHYTTIDGLIEKEDATNPEFFIPTKLKELYKKKDYGQYADKDGNLHVCFLSNNDITGGNSGSPVINGEGHLIGTAFDGNWEAMSGDISFENKVQRTISVDIRYTLFIIDKYAGAGHLVKEMTLVK